MSKKKKQEALTVHEALDRSYLMLEMFEKVVLNHPVIDTDPKLRKLANEACFSLDTLYQAIAEKQMGQSSDTGKWMPVEYKKMCDECGGTDIYVSPKQKYKCGTCKHKWT